MPVPQERWRHSAGACSSRSTSACSAATTPTLRCSARLSRLDRAGDPPGLRFMHSTAPPSAWRSIGYGKQLGSSHGSSRSGWPWPSTRRSIRSAASSTATTPHAGSPAFRVCEATGGHTPRQRSGTRCSVPSSDKLAASRLSQISISSAYSAFHLSSPTARRKSLSSTAPRCVAVSVGGARDTAATAR